jgi:hypothetical protein
MIWNPCKGRVKHDNAISTWSDGINKDLGVIYSDNCWASVDGRHSKDSSRKDPQGRTNFARAVCSAMNQTAVTWTDFKTQITATYGTERGDLIVATIQSATAPLLGAVPTAIDELAAPINELDGTDLPEVTIAYLQ